MLEPLAEKKRGGGGSTNAWFSRKAALKISGSEVNK